MDLVLDDLQWLNCHKIKPNQTKPEKKTSQGFYIARLREGF